MWDSIPFFSSFERSVCSLFCDVNKYTGVGVGWGVVHVSDQKTFTTHGPARIILSPKLYSWMVIFVREARSKVAGTLLILTQTSF